MQISRHHDIVIRFFTVIFDHQCVPFVHCFSFHDITGFVRAIRGSTSEADTAYHSGTPEFLVGLELLNL